MFSLQEMIRAVVWLVIIGVVWWIMNWAVEFIGIPEPFHKVIKVILVLVAALLAISILVGLAGPPPVMR